MHYKIQVLMEIGSMGKSHISFGKNTIQIKTKKTEHTDQKTS